MTIDLQRVRDANAVSAQELGLPPEVAEAAQRLLEAANTAGIVLHGPRAWDAVFRLGTLDVADVRERPWDLCIFLYANAEGITADDLAAMIDNIDLPVRVTALPVREVLFTDTASYRTLRSGVPIAVWKRPMREKL